MDVDADEVAPAIDDAVSLITKAAVRAAALPNCFHCFTKPSQRPQDRCTPIAA
jgi:hypothetical protein